MRRTAVVAACLGLAAGFIARTGSASALLEPGFFMAYRVETVSAGQRAEQRFRVEVTDDRGGGRRGVLLSIDGAPSYRAVYQTDDDEPMGVFDAERFEQMEGLQDGEWLPLATDDVEMFDALRAMEASLAGGAASSDSTVTLGGRDWTAQRYALADSSTTVQESASVTLRTERRTQGVAWMIPELPFGGWLRYEALTEARKVSEVGGRRFAGDPEASRETWTLVELGLPPNNK